MVKTISPIALAASAARKAGSTLEGGSLLLRNFPDGCVTDRNPVFATPLAVKILSARLTALILFLGLGYCHEHRGIGGQCR